MRSFLLAAALLAGGCSRPPAAEKVGKVEAQVEAAEPPVAEGFADLHPSLLVTNPRVLSSLESAGLSFADVLAIPAHDPPAARLSSSPLYADLVHALHHEVAVAAGVSSNAGIGSQFEHRLFDLGWLSSQRAHFELVGVVNRIDFDLLAGGSCGQTRLVYRLDWRPPSRPHTRLPLTVNVIYLNPSGNCAEVASRWLAVEGKSGEALLGALRAGPLAALRVSSPDQVELDVQTMRQNSRGRDMDDHAEYALRSFYVREGRLVEKPLRFTPSPDLDGPRKEALSEWIRSNLRDIDRGTAQLPEEFLALQATSLTPRGLSRLGNRPFSRLFADADTRFRGLRYRESAIATSPAMLVRRLDEMSCVGCHQSRSMAGFHLLGEERTPTVFNGLVIGISEHLREMLDWRFRFLRAAARGERLDEPLPMPERPADGGYGAHCVPEAKEGPRWSCNKGLSCRPSTVEGDSIGACEGERTPGSSCEDVSLATFFTSNGDRVTPRTARACQPAGPNTRCEPNYNGFSGGMCSANCDEEGKRAGDAICLRIPHHGFERECFKPDAIIEDCLGRRPNFDLELMKTCSRDEPCRDDFICARTDAADFSRGACVPPYFIFQARVDGPPLDRKDSPIAPASALQAGFTPR